MNLQESIERLPKTDLHCHLDGSMRAETILDVARRERIEIGTAQVSELKRRLVCGEKVSTLETFLEAFNITCAVLQSREAIERIAFELAEDATAEQVRYLEVRFSPILNVKKGLSLSDVLKAARRGLARAEAAYPIQTGIIVCALRVQSSNVSQELAHIAVNHKRDGVIGFDLAHAERENPPGVHADAFKIAAEGGLGLTVHAGEDAPPDYIRQAIDHCGAVRIGHGRTLIEDSALMDRVKNEGIAIECCPSSNVQINLTTDHSSHPFAAYLRAGLKVSLNTDNRLLTGIRVTDEFHRMTEANKLTWDEIGQATLNGFSSAFLPEDERSALVRKITSELQTLKPA